jgi:very-short-patch-repair endonuclease
MVLKNPEFCDKSDSMVSRITQYIKVMQSKGILFDKSPTDKARFVQLQEKEGLTEYAVTQPKKEIAELQEESVDSVSLITETPKTQPSQVDKPVESCPVCQTTPPQAFQTATPLPCSSCHVNTYFSRTKRNGAVICSLCLEREWKKGTLKEDDLLGKGETPVEAPKPEPKPQIKEWKPTDKWEHRAAQMQPQHSRIEEALLLKLQEADLHPIRDKEFCIQSTTPDFYFPDKNLAVYIDGKVHEGKEERDQTIRELLTQRHNIKVVSISYENFTQEETERILKEIQSLQ